jgi:aspartate aminotransferase
MNPILSERMQQIESSPTVAISELAQKLKKQGEPIIDLSLGEPDFDTPAPIKEAAIKAIQEGFTKYTAVDGLEVLKQAISDKCKRDNNLDLSLREIIVTDGAKQAVYNLAMATLNPGDEVLIPTPYWVSYPSIIKMAGGNPVFLPTDITQQFKITADQLAAAITPKTRFLILNSPNNPSGMVYNRQELKALSDVLLKSGNERVWVISDEIYEYAYWGEEPFSNILTVCPALKDRTVLINGASKAFAMTGWRIGYAVGPQAVIQAMKTIQSQSTTCACSISQMAAMAALNMPREQFSYMYQSYKHRHDLLIKAFKSMPNLDCIPAQGAFYLFIDVSKAIDALGLSSDTELATLLLEKAKIAVVPGQAFGMPKHIRISYATREENLYEAINRFKQIF